MTWKQPWDYKLPDSTVDMATYMLAYDVKANLVNANLNFLAKTPDAQFANPQAYLEAIITSAFGIVTNPYTKRFAPAGWSPVKAGFEVWNSAIELMKQLPVNAGDPNTASVYDAWVSGKGQLYGGHDPIVLTAPAPQPTVVQDNPSLGGTIFAH